MELRVKLEQVERCLSECSDRQLADMRLLLEVPRPERLSDVLTVDADGHWHEHIVPEDAPRDDVPGSPDDTDVVTSDEQERLSHFCGVRGVVCGQCPA